MMVAGIFSLGSCNDSNRESLSSTVFEQQFDSQSVTVLAEKKAKYPFALEQLPDSSPLAKLGYDQYRDIRSKKSNDIWYNDQLQFRIEPMAAGYNFRTPVHLNIVEEGISREIRGRKELFDFGPLASSFADPNIPLSGFRVLTRINSQSVWDEFLVFQGKSYFRAVSSGTLYGLSARGLSIHTGDLSGEEFPVFTDFWIERPTAHARTLVIYALLESPSTTGAFRFSVNPGNETVMDVNMTLFPRVPLEGLGIANLTSMFLFDKCNNRCFDDYRNAVHDSQGLQIVSNSGEQIWRALVNPSELQVSSFTTVVPRGFGLVQRSRELSDYQDLQALYNKRPSVWIEPVSPWGKGAVVLVEIPAVYETGDNITTFWRPAKTIPAEKPWHTSYRLHWCKTPVVPDLGRVVETRCGLSSDRSSRLFIIDFDRKAGKADKLRIEANTNAGYLRNLVVQDNPMTNGPRVSFNFFPGDARVAELRIRLTGTNGPATETWLYRWTSG
jgi:glucans biosynthesis protein